MSNNAPLPKENVSFLVTEYIADDWLKNHNYKHQRELKQTHINSLSRMMINGVFRQKTQINFMRLGNSYHLTNGQHTLSAIVKSKCAQNLSVIVSIAKTEEDIADDFSRHDTHLTRKFADSLVAHEVDVRIGVTRTQLNWITAGAIHAEFLKGATRSKSKTSITHDEKLQIVNKYVDIGKSTIEFFSGKTNNAYLTRKTTIAAAMLCNEKHEHAHEFWAEMAKDDGLKTGDPRKTLLEWLRSKTTGGGRNYNTGKTIVADHEFIKAMAACWNAWIDGRELKIIKYDFSAKDVEFKSVGTFNAR